jgi:hypothetical protein
MGVFEDLAERVITVSSGNAVVLEMPHIESHPAPEVIWSTSDGTIPYTIKYATVHHKLLILNASEGDEGSYRYAFNFNNLMCIRPHPPRDFNVRNHGEILSAAGLVPSTSAKAERVRILNAPLSQTPFALSYT